jgi:hypothetical protein
VYDYSDADYYYKEYDWDNYSYEQTSHFTGRHYEHEEESFTIDNAHFEIEDFDQQKSYKGSGHK